MQGTVRTPRVSPFLSARRTRYATPATLFGGFTLTILAGYAFFDKGFAYAGVPPIFVGEIGLILAIGTILSIVGRFKHGLWRCPVTWLLILFMGWGAIRTFPYLDVYGLEALRDGVIWGYSFYAIAVALVVLLLNPVERVITWYGRAALIFLVVEPIFVAVDLFARAAIPHWPWGPVGGVPILDLSAGNAAVHYAGIFSFIALGLSPTAVNVWWMPIWFLGVIPVVALNRAGLLVVSLVVTGTALLRPAFRYYIVLGLVVSCLGMLYLSGLEIKLPVTGRGNLRMISAEQLTEDVESIFGAGGPSATSDLYGTQRWRMLWWTRIIDDTIFGDYFWSGKGFGINLADADGFQTEVDHSLRSPHDIHFAILEREGVPGLIIWLLLQVSFASTLFLTFMRDLREGRHRLAKIEIWTFFYWLALIINGSFDVFIEGPVGGIWFWSVFGFGLALIVLPNSKRLSFSRATASSAPNRAAGVPVSDPV